MPCRKGVTLIELIVVMVIIGIVLACVFLNNTTPREQARAAIAQNNLLAIYSAERNYNNDSQGTATQGFAPTASVSTLSQINTEFTLNIQDDGTYLYACNNTDATGFACTATRNDGSNPPDFTITVKNQPIQLTGNVNPSCGGANATVWCP